MARDNKSQSESKKVESVKLHDHLQWYHWGVLSLSLLLTFGAWYFSSHQVAQKTQNQFDFQANQILELVQERMSKYEEALWGGVAALHMLKTPATREDWKLFADTLDIENRFPGINGIGVIHYVPSSKLENYLHWQRKENPNYHLHPSHNEHEFWPITYIEPESANLKAVGLDMAHENNRFSAAKSARDTGKATITGPITLVQDARKTPGFLFYAPWYSQGSTPEFYGDRKTGFLGLVYAPFIMKKLMDGTLTNTNRQVNFSIQDGDTELYNELNPDSADYDSHPLFQKTITVSFYGRSWKFNIQSSKIFREQQEKSQPILILIGGLFIDTLLLIIFILLAKANHRAIIYADSVTKDLQLRQKELLAVRKNLELRNNALLEANKELDQFAFIASHDLKAPLRGIAQLVQWISTDLQGKLEAQTAEYLVLVKNRVERLERLLNDLLAYSRIDRKVTQYEKFNFKYKIKEISDLLDPEKKFNITVNSDITEIETFSIPLEQILRNLIGNAIKHHHKDNGNINVKIIDSEKFYEITVKDDGPGIPVEHQQRVFDLFHTLKPRDEIEGSGLGLSIIKKILDRHNGKYNLSSDGVNGCTFSFLWPKANVN